MMQEEFSALYKAIAIAVFMVFVVMAAQFESPKFSFMVMTTILSSLVGSFAFEGIYDHQHDFLLGFLVLVEPLSITVSSMYGYGNQYRMTMDLDCLIEAGATRLRPILMMSGHPVHDSNGPCHWQQRFHHPGCGNIGGPTAGAGGVVHLDLAAEWQ